MKRVRCMFTSLVLFILCSLIIAAGAMEINYPWPSWRHDLQDTGAVPDKGYPTTVKMLWDTTRTIEVPASLNQPGRCCTTPVFVG